MQTPVSRPVLSEALISGEGTALMARRAALVVFGVALLTLAAQAKVPLWPSPVPITLGTFAVLGIGAAYGPRLGPATVLAYLLVGALGFDVFASSTAENSGLAYMMGGSGGYLVGYALAAAALGWLARRGWDRSVLWMAVAMLIGNALIYVPGLLWLHQFTNGWAQTLDWGLIPFLVGDALKLALAALLLPAAWKLVGDARA